MALRLLKRCKWWYNYDMDSKRNEEELVQIFFDADACPEVGIVEIIAKEHNVVI